MKYVIADRDCIFFKTIGGFCFSIGNAIKYGSLDVAVRNCRILRQYHDLRVITLKKCFWHDSDGSQ